MDPGTILSILEITRASIKCLIEVATELKDAPASLATIIGETGKLQLQLQRLYALQQGFPLEQRQFLDQQVSSEECLTTVRALGDLAKRIQPHDKIAFSGRVKWLWNKGAVEELLSKLSKEVDRLNKLLVPEQLYQLLGNYNQLNEKMETVIKYVSQLKVSQPVPEPRNASFDQNGIFSPHVLTSIAWHGQWRCKPGQNLTMPYFKDRKKLADASWGGNWATVKRVLQHAESTYGQKWVNTTRIYEADATPPRLSGFTPLHQAVYHGNKPVVEELLRSGAWRLKRTLDPTRSTPSNSTALDIARSLDWTHLSPLLTPSIPKPLSPKTLVALQERLHEVIRRDFGGKGGKGGRDDAHLGCFVLPELEVMTEFERCRLTFPLDPELRDPGSGREVVVELDGEELVVVSRWGSAQRKGYRVSVGGVRGVEQAVVLS